MTDPVFRGFDGPVNETDWVYLHRDGGAASASIGGGAYGGWQVTATGAGDRPVTIAPGSGFCLGVQAEFPDPTTLNLDSVSSGVRHDLIVARFDWDANTVTFVAIQGGTSPVAPASEVYAPDNRVHDFPLALVRVTAGSTVVAPVADLRIWQGDSGVIIARHVLALGYYSKPGTQVRIDTSTYTSILDGSGAQVWDVTSPDVNIAWTAVPVDTAVVTAAVPVQASRLGLLAFWRGRLHRDAGFPTTTLRIVKAGGVPSQFRASSFVFATASVIASDGTPGYIAVGTDGAVDLHMYAPTSADVFLQNLSGYRVD